MRIINIASSDNFEDILEAVKESESSSIILVVPKSNRVFKSKSRIEQLKDYFEKLGKDVSIISFGEAVIKNASLAGLKTIRESAKRIGKKDDEISNFYQERPASVLIPEARNKDLKKFVFFFLGAAIFSFIIVVFTSLTKATVRVIPKKNDFSINVPLTVSDKITKTDAVYGILPGQIIQFEKIISKTFSATGEKDVFQKAKGKITIYNNFSVTSQVLVATTRFQTPEGLVFRIPAAVSVPGAIKAGDNLKAGEIKVEVVADRAGEEYNINPTEFKIPGFLGSPKYQGFYAKSFEKFSGGFIGKGNFVTKEDLNKADESIKREIIDSIKNEIASLDGLKILDEILNIEMEKTSDSNNVGDVVKEFKVGMKGKVKVMAFKELEIADFVFQYIKNSQNLTVLEKELRVNYTEPKFDKEKNELSLKLISSGQTIENMDKERIISDILGKGDTEIKNYFSSLKGVESAQIFLSPFWVKSIPKDRSRVRIEVIID